MKNKEAIYYINIATPLTLFFFEFNSIFLRNFNYIYAKEKKERNSHPRKTIEKHVYLIWLNSNATIIVQIMHATREEDEKE